MSLGNLSRAKLPKEVRAVIASAREFLKFLDDEMRKPSTNERGKRVAAAANQFEMSLDSLEHFGIHGYSESKGKS